MSEFRKVWSLHAEAEAERHQASNAIPISTLRKWFGWDALVPDGEVEVVDTDVKNKPILAAGSLAGAGFVITENDVKDFGA